MRRRDFTAGLGAVAGWPLAAKAQQQEKNRAVAFVLPVIPEAEMSGPAPIHPVPRAFIHGLRDRGWVDGRNVGIIRRSAEGQRERAQAIFDQLVERRVEVIAVGAEQWLHRAALRATQTIPVVAVFPEDPVASGLVASLARPGGNLTGVSGTPGTDIFGKRVQLLRELAPAIERIAFVGTRLAWDYFRGAADTPEKGVFFVELGRPDQFAEALASILRERANAIMVFGTQAFVLAPQIVAFAAENRLPVSYGWRSAVDIGGLMSYGVSTVGLFRQLAEPAHLILMGAQASNVPIELPTTFELVINLKTAKALGLTIPDALLVRADEIIE